MLPQPIQSFFRQRYIAILAPFSEMNMDQLTVAVYVFDLQADPFEQA